MPANFDVSGLALPPGNKILYDDKNMPSIMFRVPKLTYKQLGLGSDEVTFPAFIVNGTEVDEIWISKYLNIVKNGRAYSLPNQDPGNSMNFDQARAYCEAKGPGWHLMTALEWGAMILWCEQNGYIPIGNNQYGKHNTESGYFAQPSAGHSNSQYATRTMTGTGPNTWYHNKDLSGIADLMGNVWEWTGGIRLVYGELQVLQNNNAADKDKSQAADSAQWMAINASTGALLTPNGSGTTSGSLKLDYQNSKLTWHTSITASQGGDGADTSFSSNFPDIAVSSAVGSGGIAMLQALGLYKKTSSLITGSVCYCRPFQAERAVNRGGFYNYTASGFGSFYAYFPRSNQNGHIGFRSAFIKLPAA